MTGLHPAFGLDGKFGRWILRSKGYVWKHVAVNVWIWYFTRTIERWPNFQRNLIGGIWSQFSLHQITGRRAWTLAVIGLSQFFQWICRMVPLVVGFRPLFNFPMFLWIAEWVGWHFALWWYCFGALATALRTFFITMITLKTCKDLFDLFWSWVLKVLLQDADLYFAHFSQTRFWDFRPRPIMGICSSLRVGKVCSVQCEFGFQFQDLLQPCADLDRNRSMVYWICMNLPWESQV